jgi:HEAT repeat protein
LPAKHAKNAKIRSFDYGSWLFVCFVVSAFLLLSAVSIAAQTDLNELREKIERGDTEAKRTALFDIRNLRSAAASRLALAALKDPDEMVRATAAGSVIFLREFEATQALIPLLTDKSEMVRREAAYALGEAPDAAATQPLVALLQKDKIIEVRGAAAMALGKIGDPSAVDALVKVLQTRPNDDNEFLRRASARSIGQIAQFIQTGRIDNLTPQNFLPEKYKQADKPKYADLAARYPAFKPAVSVLIKMLQNTKEADDTRREAAYALGAIGDRSALAALQTASGSSDPYLAETSKEALMKFARFAK